MRGILDNPPTTGAANDGLAVLLALFLSLGMLPLLWTVIAQFA